MAHHKKNPDNNEWQSDQKQDLKAQPDRVVHFVVVHIYDRAEAKAYQGKDDPSDQFPFPGHEKYGDQDKGGNQVHQERANLLPDG